MPKWVIVILENKEGRVIATKMRKLGVLIVTVLAVIGFVLSFSGYKNLSKQSSEIDGLKNTVDKPIQLSMAGGVISLKDSNGNIAKLSIKGTGERGKTGPQGDPADIVLSTGYSTNLTDSNSGLQVSGPALSLLRGCQESSILKWNDTNWNCSSDKNNTYDAGNGLTLNNIETKKDSN